MRNWTAVVRLYREARIVLPKVAAPPSGPAVLVTGATGFIGTALVRDLLRDGKRVIVLTRDARRAAGTFGPCVAAVETLDALPGEAATLLLDGQAATPRRLLAVGFRFKHLTLGSALADLARLARAGAETHRLLPLLPRGGHPSA